MPIPAAAGVIAAVVHFFSGTPVPNWRVAIMWMLLVFLVGLLMVSTWRFWSGKEINLADRHPFQRIVVIGLAIYATVVFSQIRSLAAGLLFICFPASSPVQHTPGSAATRGTDEPRGSGARRTPFAPSIPTTGASMSRHG